MKNAKVLEPLKVKTQAIDSASEVAEMILRIDDIILGSSKAKMQPEWAEWAQTEWKCKFQKTIEE